MRHLQVSFAPVKFGDEKGRQVIGFCFCRYGQLEMIDEEETASRHFQNGRQKMGHDAETPKSPYAPLISSLSLIGKG